MPHLRERERERERESFTLVFSQKPHFSSIAFHTPTLYMFFGSSKPVSCCPRKRFSSCFKIFLKTLKKYFWRESFFYVLAKKTIFSLSSLHKRTFFIDETLSLEHIYINKSFS